MTTVEMLRHAECAYEMGLRQERFAAQMARIFERDLETTMAVAFAPGIQFRRPRRISQPPREEPQKQEPIAVPDNPFWGGDYPA